MDNKELIKDIREDFELLLNKNHSEVKSLIHSITRSLARLKPQDKDAKIHLAKIAQDLISAEVAEHQFFILNNPGSKKIQYSDSFFKSLSILKDELFTMLNKADVFK